MYISWSVVFGEQPSAAKWNILGTNDASFNDGSGIANGVITSEHLNATIAARAYRNAALSINSSGGEDKVPFDVENYDLGSNFSTVTGTFTAPRAGIYHVDAQVTINDLDAATDNALVHIKVNGSDVIVNRVYNSAANGDPRPNLSDTILLAASDTVEVYANHSSATASESVGTGTTNTYLAIYFVGA